MLPSCAPQALSPPHTLAGYRFPSPSLSVLVPRAAPMQHIPAGPWEALSLAQLVHRAQGKLGSCLHPCIPGAVGSMARNTRGAGRAHEG